MKEPITWLVVGVVTNLGDMSVRYCFPLRRHKGLTSRSEWLQRVDSKTQKEQEVKDWSSGLLHNVTSKTKPKDQNCHTTIDNPNALLAAITASELASNTERPR